MMTSSPVPIVITTAPTSSHMPRCCHLFRSGVPIIPTNLLFAPPSKNTVFKSFSTLTTPTILSKPQYSSHAENHAPSNFLLLQQQQQHEPRRQKQQEEINNDDQSDDDHDPIATNYSTLSIFRESFHTDHIHPDERDDVWTLKRANPVRDDEEDTRDGVDHSDNYPMSSPSKRQCHRSSDQILYWDDSIRNGTVSILSVGHKSTQQ
jgi:hypothetical protein